MMKNVTGTLVPKDIWERLEAFWFVTLEDGVGSTVIGWTGTRKSANHPTVHRTALVRVILAKMSTIQRLKNCYLLTPSSSCSGHFLEEEFLWK